MKIERKVKLIETGGGIQMDNSIKSKCLEFLYSQVSKGNMPQIRKGMVEDLEAFVEGLKAQAQAEQMAKRLQLNAEQAAEKNDE